MITDWSFAQANLAETFDEYVREQLPWYDLASGMVAHVARHYISQGGRVYDLGAATGNMGRMMGSTLAARSASLVAIEEDAAMCAAYEGPGRVEHGRVQDVAYEPFDFAVSFLTLMFVPVSERLGLLTRLQASCRPGGAIMIVEKQDPPGGYVGTVMRRLTLAAKVAAGADAPAIVEKEVSLFGVQRPLPQDFTWGVEMFRFGEFAGWLWETPG